jgi:SAM-dependent methyltransferase
MYSRLIERLDRVTTAPRRRYAESVFWRGQGRQRDRLVSSLFFELSAPVWAGRARDDGHLAPFVAGMERCPEPQRALDLGTGAGATAALLADRFPNAEVVGFDSSRAMLRAAASTFNAPNLRFVRGDVRRLAFPDAHFDLVTMLNALPEPRELARVCKPGGTVLLANTYFVYPQGGPRGRLANLGLRQLSEATVGEGGWLLLAREDPVRKR